MNRKLLVVMGLVVMIFSSCFPRGSGSFGMELPTGIWRSVEPNIVLYIEPYYQSPLRSAYYLGIYSTKHEEIKIFTLFDQRGILTLVREDSLDVERGGINLSAGTVFDGWFDVIGDEIHYTLNTRTQERTGYDVIIFHRVEDYEPINPEDWFLSENQPAAIDDRLKNKTPN